MKINILSKDIVGKIAAGEVVERPASVIKELVENSIDAGSDRIEIEFIDGGLISMQVSDNGSGMSGEELELSVKRHATSKIRSLEDLEKIATMGFRGEALPSIAAVSRMSMVSRPDGGSEAASLKIEGGSALAVEPASRPKGTTVKVEELFYNVPARKKFMKSESTERRHIISTVEALALSRRDIGFKLSSNGRDVFEIPASSLKERAEALLGNRLAEGLIEVDFKNPYVGVNGFISKPGVSYSGRSRLHLFVNSRPISSPLISHAVSDAYRQFIEPGRYPACVLFITISPELVDVNVHPSKKEVKFVNQQGVHQIISKVVRSRLEQTSAKFDVDIASSLQVKGQKDRSYSVRPAGQVPRVAEARTGYLDDIDLSRATRFSFSAPEEKSPENSAEGDSPTGKILPRFQWKNKYVVAEDDEGILIIDQHTAWERINYEKLKDQFENRKVESQGNLIPEVLELEKSRAELLSENLELLKSFGIYAEEFGPNTFKITAVPAVAGRIKGEQETFDTIEDILSSIEESENPGTDESAEEILKVISCRSSIKAGDQMSDEEMKAMVVMLKKCAVPHRCPHGRPVIIRLTEKELDSRFGR